MEQTIYEDAFQYKMIYIMTIHDAAHSGLLKIGMTSFASSLGPSQLPPDCPLLKKAASERIKQYTKTALNTTELLYTELAFKIIQMQDGTQMTSTFNDTDVHHVLDRSGYLCRKFPDTDRDTEWYQVDLQTAIRAIQAYKAGRKSLSPSEKTSPAQAAESDTVKKITLRQEQREAVEKTLNVFRTGDRMLWDCKMRFGKTVTAYELIRQGGYRKTLVVTHRPVVETGWSADHDLIFGAESRHLFLTKKATYSEEYDAAVDIDFDRTLRRYDTMGQEFTCFVSMQDLRGSKIVGGKWDKNNAIFHMDWDLIIYDEAHEGTQTDLGQRVQQLLDAPENRKAPKVLSLTGTAYNLLNQYEDEKTVYTWDYVMEQRRKREFAEMHPDEPNPYEDLPELRILTFDLRDSMETSYRFETTDMAFNFREFFRTWTGNPEEDFCPIPAGAQVGDFVHADDVWNFLNLITASSEDSLYPFSNQTYRDLFRHTFWMVPGVKEARALSRMLKQHPVFSYFAIANVAGEGDQEVAYDNALALVQDVIRSNPYSITISCGRLTTGVTVPEWSAVLMLAGSASTAASGYMQTIFRVQSAGSVNGKQKKTAYVFDFAPDRALQVLAEVHSLSSRAKSSDADRRAAMGEFLNFCPVIAISGTQMRNYDVPAMMRQLKRLTVDRAIQSGFEDESIYKDTTGIVMNDADVKLFNELAEKIHGQKKSKLPKKVTINSQGLTEEEYDAAQKSKSRPKRERTQEEKDLLQKEQAQKKEREKVIALLRAVSIRLPMLIYGAKVDLTEDIHMEDFITLVDDESWKEFLPENVTKPLFRKLLKYYDEDVIVGAGLRIRRLARAADDLPPIRRVQRIAEIFSLFRNPDKETVLTPWRVVNMHMGDMLGGCNFYAEGYAHDGLLDDPRWIDNGAVTADLFRTPHVRLLEMNSKSGLYPLYLCCSLYMQRLPAPENQIPTEQAQQIWRDVLDENIFVLCKTKMAENITRRTLAGYHDDWTVRTGYLTKLLERMQSDPARVARNLTNPKTWKMEGERLKFSAIVGNPPYQMDDGGNGASARPIYNIFVEQAKKVNPQYISMIMPARWYSGGKGLDEFRQNMLNDSRISKLVDFTDSTDCFPSVDISGGVCYFLRDSNHHDTCQYTNHFNGNVVTVNKFLNRYDTFIRYPIAEEIISKVATFNEKTMDDMVTTRKPFGLATNVLPLSEGDLTLRYNKGTGPYQRSRITVGTEYIDKWKVMISYLTSEHAGQPDSSGMFRVLSTMEILPPGFICTETYLLAGCFDSQKEAINLQDYLSTKFVRFLIWQVAVSQHITKKCFSFVPIQDFTQHWDDEILYGRYGLNSEEISFIESIIRPVL